MNFASLTPMHVGPGAELTAFGYLVLVLLHLLAFGAVTLLVSRVLDALGASDSESRTP